MDGQDYGQNQEVILSASRNFICPHYHFLKCCSVLVVLFFLLVFLKSSIALLRLKKWRNTVSLSSGVMVDRVSSIMSLTVFCQIFFLDCLHSVSFCMLREVSNIVRKIV